MNNNQTTNRKLFAHRFARPPKAILHARLDNIAIVPASMLPFEQSFKDILSNLPKGAVFLCHAKQNSRQTKILERVGELLQKRGHRVTNLTMEQVQNA